MIYFDENRVYTNFNCNKLRPGDKILAADNLNDLKQMVQEGETKQPDILIAITAQGHNCFYVFSSVYGDFYATNWAYLIKKAAHRTNYPLFLPAFLG